MHGAVPKTTTPHIHTGLRFCHAQVRLNNACNAF